MHVDPTRTTVLRRRAKEFIERYLGPRDLAAVVQIGYSPGVLHFTSDTSVLLAALDRAIGEKTGSEAVAIANADPEMVAAGASPDRDAGVRRHMAERAVFELAALAQALGDHLAPRKALVLFSEGLDVDMGNPAYADLFEQVRYLYAASARANVTIYTVDPRGISSVADDLIQVRGTRRGVDPAARALNRELQVAQHSLRNLADQTGGLAWVGSNDFARGFRQIVEDNSTYYLLGYYSDDARQDGKYRTLTVRVNRRGVSVRARKGYYARTP
jgi:VWFA-related protein